MAKIAIYTRVSTHWQIDKDSLSVQQRELIAYSQLILNCDDYEVFEDAGYSAKDTDRPSLQKMMLRIKHGEFTHLLVWKIDRISRNLLDFSQMYSELKTLGVTFISKNEQFDTSTAIGEAMLKIILVFAELERKMTAERVTAVMLSRATQGKWNGGRVPYGYTYDPDTKTFFIEKQEASLIVDIYAMYAKMQSLLSVSRCLTDLGITSRNSLWSPVTIRKILTNNFYIGDYTYNIRKGIKGEKHDKSEWITITDHHPAIIDRESFATVNQILKKNLKQSHVSKAINSSSNDHIFKKLLICGHCGTMFSSTSGRTHADGTRPSVYGCQMRRRSKTLCDNKFTSDSFMGQFVFQFLANAIRLQGTVKSSTTIYSINRSLLSNTGYGSATISAESLTAIKQKYLSCEKSFFEPSKDYKPKLDTTALTSEKDKLESSLQKLKNLYLYGSDGISESDYLSEKSKIISRIAEIESCITEIENPEDTEFLQSASFYILSREIEKEKLNFNEMSKKIDKRILKEFVNSTIKAITITAGMPSKITFKNGLDIIISEKI